MEKKELKTIINSITNIFKKYHLDYNQVIYVTKKAREKAKIKKAKQAKTKIERLSKEEQKKLLDTAYRNIGNFGLMIKTLFFTGSRVSEFVNIKVTDFYFDEQIIKIEKGKGNKQRVVPITKELAQELKTYLNKRKQGYLFESIRNDKYSARRIQQIVKSLAEKAGINKRVHPHLLRHTVATFLLEHGMPLEQIQIFLGHERIENTRIYAKNSTYQIQEDFRKAMKDY